MRDPHAAALAHQRVERDRDTAGGGVSPRCRRRPLSLWRYGSRFETTTSGRAGRASSSPAWARPRRNSMLARPARGSRSSDTISSLHLVAPAGKLGRHDRRETEGNPCLRHQAGPGVARRSAPAVRPIAPRRAGPCRMKTSRATASASAASPITASASRRSEAPTATKNTTSTGGAPRLHGGTERVALRDREVLDHHARQPAPPAAAEAAACCRPG